MKNFDLLGFLRRRNDTGRTTVSILSDPAQIRVVSDRILQYVSRITTADDKLFDIRLCIEESLRNAIVHGNKSDRNKQVRITYWVEQGRIFIEIRDHGAGFDHKNVPNPTHDKNILRNSGRGVHLVLNLMDEVRFNERGNQITMIKNLKT